MDINQNARSSCNRPPCTPSHRPPAPPPHRPPAPPPHRPPRPPKWWWGPGPSLPPWMQPRE